MRKIGKETKNKGFTLIELLAVITIMGILLLVAIPAVSRTIENSRRDTFASLSAEYMNAVRKAVLADEIECMIYNSGTGTSYGSIASGMPNGTYYFPICTNADWCSSIHIGGGNAYNASTIVQSTTDLLESGGKSPFGGSDVRGYVIWDKVDSVSTDPTTKVKFKILLQDKGKHGFDDEKTSEELKRANIITQTTKTERNSPNNDDITNNGHAANPGLCKIR